MTAPAGTTMVAVKLALRDAIRARAAAPGVWIGYGDGDGRTRKSIRLRESVSTQGAGSEGVKPAGFRGGRPRMDEEYEIRVECEVIGLPTPEANESAVVALGQHVEDAVFDPTVQDAPGVKWAVVSSRGLDTDETGENRSVYVISIKVHARTL